MKLFAIRYWRAEEDFDGGTGDGIPSWGNAYESTFYSEKLRDDAIKQLREEDVYAFELGEADAVDDYGVEIIDWSGDIVKLSGGAIVDFVTYQQPRRPHCYIPGHADYREIATHNCYGWNFVWGKGEYSLHRDYKVFEYSGSLYIQKILVFSDCDSGTEERRQMVGIPTLLDRVTQTSMLDADKLATWIDEYFTPEVMKMVHAEEYRIPESTLNIIVDAVVNSLEGNNVK